MPNASKQDALAAALAKLTAPRPTKAAAQKSPERPLYWNPQSSVDHVAAELRAQGVEAIAIPLADGSTAYEYRKASAVSKKAA